MILGCACKKKKEEYGAAVCKWSRDLSSKPTLYLLYRTNHNNFGPGMMECVCFNNISYSIKIYINYN